MLILDPGHRTAHACTDTLGVNTVSSECLKHKALQKDIYGVKERLYFFQTADIFYMLYAQYEHFPVLHTSRIQKSVFSQKSLTILNDSPGSLVISFCVFHHSKFITDN